MPDVKKNTKWLVIAIERLELPLLAWKPYGTYIYPFLRMLILKLVEVDDAEYEKIFSEPVRFSDYIVPIANRQKIITFFEKDARLLKIRERFPEKKTGITGENMEKLRQYYYVLYPILVLKRDLLVKLFEEELANQDYDRIVKIYHGWHLARPRVPETRQLIRAGELWNKVTAIVFQGLGETGKDLFSEKNGKKLLKKIEERLWEELGIE